MRYPRPYSQRNNRPIAGINIYINAYKRNGSFFSSQISSGNRIPTPNAQFGGNNLKPGVMDPPSSNDQVKPEKLEEVKEEGPSIHCNLFDTEIVHKIAQALLPGLASACVDNTTGGLFKSPASVAVDIRREMLDYLFQRSENFVAESVVLEGGPDAEVSDHPYDIISDFIDDYSSSKRNIFSRVSGWLLSDRREDRIDDFVQEMEINGFWLLARREAVAQTMLKNVDFKNTYHCDKKFKSEEDLAEHVPYCNFRMMDCMNEGCNSRFRAAQMNYHDSVCPFKILPCEQKCSESIMRRDMDRHCITVCPMKLVNCPFYPVGCQSAIPNCAIDEHLSEYLHSHLILILKPVHEEASLADLQKRAKELEKLSSPGRLVSARGARSLTFAIKHLEAKLGPIEVSKADEVNDKDVEITEHGERMEMPNKKEEHLGSSHKHSESTDSSPRKSSLSPSKQEENRKSTDSSPRKSSASPLKQEENGKSTDSSPRKSSVSSSKQEENPKSLDENSQIYPMDSFPEHSESTDSSPRKSSASPSKQEENTKSLDEKERHEESDNEVGESKDSSPGKFSVAPSEQEENRKSLDKREELNESSTIKDKHPGSPTVTEMLVEPPTIEEYTESTMEKEAHAESPEKGDDHT